MKNGAMTIKEIAQLAGITVRTLHYYDQIGLLKPAVTEDNGYRLYDEQSLKELQQILFFRELDFPLKQIKQIMLSDSYDERKTLSKHKQLLKLKMDRISGLIKLIDDTLEGEKVSFKEFDMAEIEKHRQKYEEEARQRWGSSDAYKQSEAKTKKYTKEDWQKISEESSEIFEEFAACMRDEEGCKSYGELVRLWQAHITKYYYDCTDEILLGLGEMYVLDERFKQNIDKHGEGLADFIRESIKNTIQKN